MAKKSTAGSGIKHIKMSVGTIYQTRPKGKFYFRYQLNGSRKCECLETAVEEEARKKAEDLIALVKAPTQAVIAAHVEYAKGWSRKKERLELSRIWEVYSLHPERVRPKTQKILNIYKAYIYKFINWASAHHPEVQYMDQIRDVDENGQKLDSNIAAEFASYLATQQLSVDTFNKHIARIGHIFRTLSKYLDAPSPWDNPKLKRSSKEEIYITDHRRPFPKEKEDEMFELLKPTSNFRIMNKPEIEVLFYILKYTGQRQKDCVNLSWNKIDTKRRRLWVTQEKTGKEVSIPIAPELYEMLERAADWKIDGNDKVLPRTAERYAKKAADGSEVGVNLVNKQILNVIEHVGLIPSVAVKGRRKKLTVYGVHSFRHAFASHCAETGVSRAVCASILGADTSIISAYYTHIGDEAQEKAVLSLSGKHRTAEEKIAEALLFLSALPKKSKAMLELEKILNS